MDIQMAVGDPARLFHITPTGANGEVVAWPTMDPLLVNSSVPSVASATVTNLHDVVVTPLHPGASLVTVTGATCTTYINVHVAAAPVDHLTVSA